MDQAVNYFARYILGLFPGPAPVDSGDGRHVPSIPTSPVVVVRVPGTFHCAYSAPFPWAIKQHQVVKLSRKCFGPFQKRLKLYLTIPDNPAF